MFQYSYMSFHRKRMIFCSESPWHSKVIVTCENIRERRVPMFHDLYVSYVLSYFLVYLSRSVVGTLHPFIIIRVKCLPI